MPTLYARAMRRAAELCGDEALARELGVTLLQLNLWLKGVSEPPTEAFLKVADILGDFALQELKEARPATRTLAEPDSIS